MKKIVNTLLLLIPFALSAQANMYVTADLEGGILTTSHQNLDATISDAIIDSEQSHYNIKGSLGFVMEWDNNLSATLGLSQSLRFWNLEGEKNGNTLKVSNRQNFPSVYLGGFYQIPITSGNVDLNLYFGSKFSFDFVNYNSLNERDGVDSDYVVSFTEESEKVSMNIIPEIGIKGYFDSGNYWQISCRYNMPINGDIVKGTIEHYLNNSVAETIKYDASGQYIAIGLTYGFRLRK